MRLKCVMHHLHNNDDDDDDNNNNNVFNLLETENNIQFFFSISSRICVYCYGLIRIWPLVYIH
jgi:fatty acid desaturase